MDPICIQNVSTLYTTEDARKALTALFESDCIERVKAFPSGENQTMFVYFKDVVPTRNMEDLFTQLITKRVASVWTVTKKEWRIYLLKNVMRELMTKL